MNTLNRGADPVEVARVVVFLASDAASFVNGQTVSVGGGFPAIPFYHGDPEFYPD